MTPDQCLSASLGMIDSFTGKHRFLSNFYASRVEMYGEIYPTVEHAFQAAKAAIVIDRQRIRRAATPGQAKKLGRTLVLRPGWDDMRLSIMEELLRRKFSDSELGFKLVLTHPEPLVEGNTWGDTFWGTCEGQGENHLGRLLMKIREELMK